MAVTLRPGLPARPTPATTSGRGGLTPLPACLPGRARHPLPLLPPRSVLPRGGGGGGGADPDALLVGEEGAEPASALLSPRRRPLEVEAIPRPVLERVEVAVEAAGGRVTVGDVAAAAGVPLASAEAALNALAADTAGRLQVSPSGDIAYVLPPNFRGVLRSKSAWLRLAPRIDAAANAVGWAGRVAFGGALLASLAIAAAALVALSVAAQSGGDDRDRRGGGRGYYGGGGGMPVSIWWSPGDLWFWFDPWGYRRARRGLGGARGGGRGNAADPPAMGFLESVFSFVFGDGDPNATFDADRWRAAGRAIAARGGVVTAEELAPFLDLPPPAARDADGDGLDDEAWVLPALVRFNGRAEVDESGRLLYVFPDLQKTAAGATGAARSRWSLGAGRREVVGAPPPPPPPALEAAIPFTRASSGQRLAAAGLGAANIAAVSALASALAERGAAAALVAQGFGFVLPLLPWLRAYAAAYFLIPAVRWVWNGRLNSAIASRNEARADAANSLRAPTRALAAKLGAARARAERVALRPEDAVFDSGSSTVPPSPEALVEAELAEFDRKLGKEGRPFTDFLKG